MTLAVIGAGLGRTGTMSLKLALEQLGFGPCYHMAEVLKHPEYARHWLRATAGEEMDWEEVFAGYASTTDWPACDHWQALVDAYPAARVILTVRDPEAWFTSTQNTIFSPANTRLASDPSPVGEMMRAIGGRQFAGDFTNRARCLTAFAHHNAEVREGVPPARLLEFNVSEGWAPLCRFLDVPIPATAFPATNTTEEFRARAATMMAAAGKAS